MMNYVTAAAKSTKKTKAPAPSSSPHALQQNKQKKTKTQQVLAGSSISITDMETDNHTTTPPTVDTQAKEWQATVSKNSRNLNKKITAAKQQKQNLLSDSETESDEDDKNTTVMIPDKQSMFIADNSLLQRYTLTLDIDATLDPEQFLIKSVEKMNKAVRRLTTDGQLSGYSGKAVILPWEDTELYSNRAWTRLKRSTEHTQLLPFVRYLLFGYGAPKGRKQDTKVAKKYCRINIGWLSPDGLAAHKIDSLRQYLSQKKIIDPESFGLYPAPTSAIHPTIAVQFRNSAITNPTNWSDKGQEDCLLELNSMIRSFLPPNTIAGLKRVTLATGQNFMRGDPSMLSLECEKSEESTVTRDILQAFRTANRKNQIREKRSVPWIAVPYFKGQDIQANQKYLPQYADIKTKESIYQNGIMMKYVDSIHALDVVASSHFHLSKEVLKQLEQDIWDKNETPIRALIYDKLWDETKQELLQNILSKKKNPTDRDVKDAKSQVSFSDVLDAMAAKGYATLAPYDEQSFPSPNPSSRTLREYLMTMKSRRVTDAANAPFVFESINNTDDGRVLFTFSKATMEEATTILDCLPLVIQHEMHLDPSCFLTLHCLKMCQGSYYNPLSRTGVTAVAACLTEEITANNNPKHRIPQAIRSASAQEMEQLFKRTENRMFTFSDDSSLTSIANSIASYKLPECDVIKSVSQVTNLQTLLQTHHLSSGNDEELSALSETSNLSFDSKASKNRYEIERRADQMAAKKVDDTVYQMKFKQGLSLLKTGLLTEELAYHLELPYTDIMATSQTIHSSKPTDRLPHLDPIMADSCVAELPGSEMSFSGDSIDNMEDRSDNVSKTGEDMSDEDDNTDNMEEDADIGSVDTQLRGSPNKNKVTGNHNAGVVK